VTYCGYDDDLSDYLNAGPVIGQCDFNTSGGTGTDGYGGNAEDIWLIADYYDDGYWDENSIVDFRGTLTANGGNGTDGGGYAVDSDWIELYGPTGVTFTGNVFCSGGNATAAGGDGGGYDGGVEFGTYDGDLTITGNITANGGNGSGSGSGGDGVEVYFWGGADGEQVLTIKGNISSNGGNGGSDGSGGYGYYVYVDHFYGFVDVKGNLSANGGSGSGSGDGGGAGWVELDMYEDLTMTGNINTRGGDALGTGDGGDGYVTYIDAYVGSVEYNGTVDASGGRGLDYGGLGGNDGYYPGIYIVTEYGDMVVVTGKLINRGGNARDVGQGGYAGPVQVYAPGHVYILGSIDASGGDVIAPASGSIGGDGSYDVDVFSNLGSGVTGTVNVDGGTGDTDGALGYFWLDGVQYSP